jgi:DNA uptake protein ComE-like DNA-binding protein
MSISKVNRPALVLLAALFTGCGAEEAEPEASGASEDAAAVATQAEGAQSSALLDPSTAERDALTQEPHITPELAAQLIASRPFDDMLEVDALLAAQLDEAQREEVYAQLFKPLDLNAASEEEILLIPGVGDRMAHEFEEYRPYAGIEQFRREIGKYVDEAEVARLERYVRIP